MAKFTDNKQREWSVRFDIELAREVRNLCGVNVLTVEGLNQLSADPILLGDVVHAICFEQCERLGVTPQDFRKELWGEALQHAGDAIVEALVDFSPPRQREILRQMQSAGKALQETLAGMVNAKIPPAIEQLRKLIPGSSLPVTPVSSASTPDT